MTYIKQALFCKQTLQIFLIISVAFFSFGCASTTIDGDVSDPIESTNRNIYDFNEGFDRIIMKPLAKGYQKLPSPVQTGTHNFFSNLDDVVVIVNDVLQLNIEQFSSDVLRLSINTIFGLFGLIDMATPMGLPKHEESFADTLGYWGVGSGSYVVLPIFGPSSVRDAPSMVIDFLMHPLSLVSPTPAAVGLATARGVDIRSDLLKTTDLRDELAIDPYIFTRESYYQWRQNRIHNGEAGPRVIIEDFEN